MDILTKDTLVWDDAFGNNRPIKEVYNDSLLEYKEQARTELVNELGYKPPIELSMTSEYWYRNSLDRYSRGELSKELLAKHLVVKARLINNRVLDSVPELKHQAEKYCKPDPFE